MTGRRGFTLIEVMVAVFLLAVASGGILLGLMLSLSQGKESQERVMAQIIAGSVMDELKAHRYGDPSVLAGWSKEGDAMVRKQTVETVVEGLLSPATFTCQVKPVASSDPTRDEVQVRIAWTEPSGPATLLFNVPMEKGWNRAVSRGSQPSKVASNWHQPAAYTIPSEPSYRTGSNDHTVDPTPPDSGDIVNDKTKKYQSLYNQLTQAKVQLNADEDAVSADKAAISDTEAQLAAENGKKNPDQATVDRLQGQLTQQQAQLGSDQAKVSADQQTIADIQKQIDALDANGSD